MLADIMSTPKRADIVGEWVKKGLITAKHDPEQINITWDTYRTVLTPQAADNLHGFIKSGEYKITHYYDTKFKNSSGFFELEPTGNTPFTVAGSGIASGSVTPSGPKDRIVIACDKSGNWKAYAENASTLQNSLAEGRLQISGKL
jgi:hypothetical protein